MYAKTFLIEDMDAQKAFTDLTSDPLIVIKELHQVYAEGYGVKTTVYYEPLKELTFWIPFTWSLKITCKCKIFESVSIFRPVCKEPINTKFCGCFING